MKILRTVLSAVLLAVPVGASGVALMHTDWLAVREVGVEGTDRLVRESVAELTGVEEGTPLGAVEVERVQRAVAALPEVASVSVTRQWPNRLAVDLSERVAVGAVDDGEPGVVLVDATGFGFAREAAPPAGVPLLEVPRPGVGDPVTGAALAVVQSLRPELRDRVATVAADDPGRIRLLLDDGSAVEWGGADRSETKADVLAALLPTSAAEYDVSAPELAVTRG